MTMIPCDTRAFRPRPPPEPEPPSTEVRVEQLTTLARLIFRDEGVLIVPHVSGRVSVYDRHGRVLLTVPPHRRALDALASALAILSDESTGSVSQ